MASRNTFYETITEAVADIAAHGFDSQARLEEWVRRIRVAAAQSLTPTHVLEAALTSSMRTIFRRLVERGDLVKQHPGVSRLTIQNLKPTLRPELDRRIMGAASLIRLNRHSALEKTLQRFSGWTTSVPAGGSKAVDRGEVKTDIRKALAQLPFEERRVLIDQGHKFAASLSRIVAEDQNAIAAEWNHHHVTYPRTEHLARNGHILLVRGSWAHQRGLVKVGAAGYVDQVEQPGEWVYCRCTYRYLYALRDLPAEMLTARGVGELRGVRVA